MKKYISIGALALAVIVLLTAFIGTYLDADSNQGENIRWALTFLGPVSAVASITAIGLCRSDWM